MTTTKRAFGTVLSMWVVLSWGAPKLAAQQPEPAAPAPEPAAAPVAPVPAAAPPASTEAAAEPPRASQALDGRVKHLDAWLSYLERRGHGQRVGRAIWQFVETGLFLGGGALILTDNDRQGGRSAQNWREIAGASIFFGIGAGSALAAIHNLSSESTDEERYARWHSLRTVDEVAIARFEGELAAQAALAHQERIYMGIGAIALSTSGAVLLMLTPSARITQEARVVSYIGGGLVVLLGAWEAVLKLAGESQDERALRLYNSGMSPDSASMRLRFAPTYAAGGGGFSLSGQF